MFDEGGGQAMKDVRVERFRRRSTFRSRGGHELLPALVARLGGSDRALATATLRLFDALLFGDADPRVLHTLVLQHLLPGAHLLSPISADRRPMRGTWMTSSISTANTGG